MTSDAVYEKRESRVLLYGCCGGYLFYVAKAGS